MSRPFVLCGVSSTVTQESKSVLVGLAEFKAARRPNRDDMQYVLRRHESSISFTHNGLPKKPGQHGR